MIDLDLLKATASAGKGDEDVVVSRRWLAQVAAELAAARRDQARGAICEGPGR